MEDLLTTCLILLPLGISLRMSLRLLYGARGPQLGDPIHQMVSAASWVLTVLPLLILIAVGTTWLSWLLLLIVGLSGLELIVARRAMQRRSVWELLNASPGGQRPAPSALRNHQGRFTGIVGRSFRQLVRSLEQGTDVPTAIGQHRRALPAEAQAYASIGAIADAIPAEAGSSDADRQDALDHLLPSAAGQQIYQRLTYLSTVVLIMTAVVTFLALRIIPSYQAIFNDFDLELPAITVSLIRVCSLYVSSFAAVGVLVAFFATVVFSIVVAVFVLCDIAVLRPIIDRLFFTNHRALVLRLFAVAAERRQSFAQIVGQLTHGPLHYPSRYTRQRLAQVGQAMSEGQDWKAALASASIIKRADLPMLETAQQADNLPWALRLMAGQKMRSMIFRWNVVEKIAFPLAIVLVGLLVCWVCVALFAPLVTLINSLA